jgi:hypothetical protein
MTAGFCADFSADTARLPMDIAIAIGNDVFVPRLCEEPLFRTAIPHDAVNVGTPVDNHRDYVSRTAACAQAFDGGAIE